MANVNLPRRPRIRKNAPTVRERVEAASVQEETAKPSRLRGLFSTVKNKAGAPFRKLNLRGSRFGKLLAKFLRPVAKVLGWLVPSYFINSWREVRQVTWPSRKDTWRLTLAVFIFSIVFGALVAGVDKGLDEVFKKVVLK